MPVNSARGGAALEFALALPVLMLLTLPMIDFTWYFLSMQNVQTAVQSGTRVGARTPMDDDPTAAAIAATSASLQASMPLRAGMADYDATISDKILRVEVHIPYEPLAGYVVMPDHLVAFHQMRVEDL